MIEKLGYGLSLTFIGIGTVFFVLFLLQMVMKIQEMLLSKKTSMQAKEIVTTDAKSEPQKMFNKQISNENTIEMQSNILVAITAAISVYIEEQQRPYKLVSVRKAWDKEASHVWTLTGRQNILDSHNHF